jgi:F-type H+-transporting ATPase subunit delta
VANERDLQAGIEIADVYAAALFDLAAEADQLEEVYQELRELLKLGRQEPGFARFMAASSVDDDARAASLESMFRGKLSDILLNTLQVMNQHGRAGLVDALARAFELRLEDRRGQVEVVARSAVELSDEQKQEIARAAERLSGRKPLVTYEVDPELIGGLVLRIGDYRFDNSVRWHLNQARLQLHGRSQRGLAIGMTE